MYSSYGKWIIRKATDIPETSRITAVIRHSERPDFRDIAPEKWNSTLLTGNGERSAVEFGTALVDEAGFASVQAEGWGLQRCQLTAKKIMDGATLAGSNGSSYSEVSDFVSPISDLDLYRKYIKDGKYFEMVRDWFSGGPLANPMRPYKPYSRNTISNILREHMPLKGGITVIVTHDLFVLPIINQIFDRQMTEVDFMDGILITGNGDKLEFFTKDSQRKLLINDL